jgi:F0F1-type ATP synthase assembly protein I
MATERSHRRSRAADRVEHVDDDAHRAPRAVGEGEAWSVLAYLITGPLLYGGLGWLADRWLGTTPWLVVVGIVGGMALAVYVVWVRYGAHDRRPPSASPDAGRPE